MKTLNELYLILWNRIKDLNWISGLCLEMNILRLCGDITRDEYIMLIEHFNDNKPSELIHPEFLTDTYTGGCYWWSVTEDVNPINRKKFIQKMIEITK